MTQEGSFYLSDESEAAGRELLVVDVVPGHGVGVHQVRAALKKFRVRVANDLSLLPQGS